MTRKPAPCLIPAPALLTAALLTACAPPQPQAAPATIPAAYEQALALSPVPHRLAEAHDHWRIDGADPHDADYLERLRGRIAQDRAAGAARPSTADLWRGCAPVVLKGCDSRAGGYLRFDDTVLWWQLQDGFTDADGVGGGVMVFAPEGGALRPILWDFEAGRYGPPLLVKVDAGLLLIAPGVSRGTGAGDSTVMMILRDGRWRPVDTRWQDRARDQLGGFETRHQPRWNFEEMTAWTPLWREGDANCCGTAGSADLQFDIIDDRLTVVSAELKRAGDG